MTRRKKQLNSDITVATVDKVSHKKHWTRVLLIIVVCVVLAGLSGAVAVGTYRYIRDRQNRTPQVCSDALLNKAKDVLTPEKYKELAVVTEEIKKLPNYQADPNCLAITTTYYVNISDSKNAKTNYEQLTKVYRSDPSYNKIIAGKVMSPDQFKPVIEFLGKQFEQVQKNSKAGSVVQ
jgi:hypothetical protein